jgi:hypothetical protein
VDHARQANDTGDGRHTKKAARSQTATGRVRISAKKAAEIEHVSLACTAQGDCRWPPAPPFAIAAGTDEILLLVPEPATISGTRVFRCSSGSHGGRRAWASTPTSEGLHRWRTDPGGVNAVSRRGAPSPTTDADGRFERSLDCWVGIRVWQPAGWNQGIGPPLIRRVRGPPEATAADVALFIRQGLSAPVVGVQHRVFGAPFDPSDSEGPMRSG